MVVCDTCNRTVHSKGAFEIKPTGNVLCKRCKEPEAEEAAAWAVAVESAEEDGPKLKDQILFQCDVCWQSHAAIVPYRVCTSCRDKGHEILHKCTCYAVCRECGYEKRVRDHGALFQCAECSQKEANKCTRCGKDTEGVGYVLMKGRAVVCFACLKKPVSACEFCKKAAMPGDDFCSESCRAKYMESLRDETAQQVEPSICNACGHHQHDCACGKAATVEAIKTCGNCAAAQVCWVRHKTGLFLHSLEKQAAGREMSFEGIWEGILAALGSACQCYKHVASK